MHIMRNWINVISQAQIIRQTTSQKVKMNKAAWHLWNLQWIVEQQECLHGSLQQIMSITYCVENPSPLFSFPPYRKQMGHTAWCLAEVLITVPCPYEQLLQTIVLWGPLHSSPSLVCFADITCSCRAIDTTTWSMHETQFKSFKTKTMW